MPDRTPAFCYPRITRITRIKKLAMLERVAQPRSGCIARDERRKHTHFMAQRDVSVAHRVRWKRPALPAAGDAWCLQRALRISVSP
jgi:hypothetical protein